MTRCSLAVSRRQTLRQSEAKPSPYIEELNGFVVLADSGHDVSRGLVEEDGPGLYASVGDSLAEQVNGLLVSSGISHYLAGRQVEVNAPGF